jgi:hypothetical protein
LLGLSALEKQLIDRGALAAGAGFAGRIDPLAGTLNRLSRTFP